MTSPNGPVCDHCRKLLPNGEGVADFFFTECRYCGPDCLQADHEQRRQADKAKVFCIERYGSRFWAVRDGSGELVVVTVYRKGAQEVVRRLNQR